MSFGTGLAVGYIAGSSNSNSDNTEYNLGIAQCNALPTKAETLVCLKDLQAQYDHSETMAMYGCIGLLVLICMAI